MKRRFEFSVNVNAQRDAKLWPLLPQSGDTHRDAAREIVLLVRIELEAINLRRKAI